MLGTLRQYYMLMDMKWLKLSTGTSQMSNV
jgi:hypothetical protein